MNLSELEALYAANSERFHAEWCALLRIPSVSALEEHSGDCRQAAELLRDRLNSLGFAVDLMETKRHPIVFGRRTVGEDRPTLLFYGHYDVQPVDPVDQWDSPPFEPTLRNGRVYARGAEDNKGQLSYALSAIETLIGRDALSANVLIFIEGEEEISSVHAPDVLTELGSKLAADLLMVCDTGMVASGAPTIIAGLRGIGGLTLTLRGAKYDLHSGLHGGLAPNAARGMAQLVASLHDDTGRVAVAGFYEGVPEVRTLINEPPFSEDEYVSLTGVQPVGGEAGFSPYERLGLRPTLEVNGLHSGYGGQGSKTIIPCEALAKLTFRLVAGQDPQHVLRAVVDHLKEHTPKGLKLEISDCQSEGGALMVDIHSPVIALLRDVLSKLSPKAPVLHFEGASVPIVARLAEVSGAMPLLVGFGMEEDRIHAPNESFSLEQFRLGFLYVASFLSRWSSQHG